MIAVSLCTCRSYGPHSFWACGPDRACSGRQTGPAPKLRRNRHCTQSVHQRRKRDAGPAWENRNSEDMSSYDLLQVPLCVFRASYYILPPFPLLPPLQLYGHPPFLPASLSPPCFLSACLAFLPLACVNERSWVIAFRSLFSPCGARVASTGSRG